jgi:hypothetical protein
MQSALLAPIDISISLYILQLQSGRFGISEIFVKIAAPFCGQLQSGGLKTGIFDYFSGFSTKNSVFRPLPTKPRF